VGVVFALWVLGVWGTVPDTERAVVVMGVTAALLPALWPGLRVRIGWWGAPLAVALLGFVIATDGAARPTAMVGSLGMLGLPLVAAALTLGWPKSTAFPPWWLIAAQALHVIVSGRVAGQLGSPLGALAVAALSALAIGGVLAFAVPRPRSRRGIPEMKVVG
jgi:hypothetical protein